MRINGSNMQSNNMPINCGMKGMHENAKALKVEQNNTAALKETQKIPMEKHKGGHVDFKI